MPPFEVGPPRAIGAITADVARKAGTTSNATQAGATPNAQAAANANAASATRPSVALSEARDPGKEPVDVERVAQIRKAVETGTYPLVPARIADAMIAAGILLRSSNA